MNNVLVASEVEFYIDTMKPTELESIGTKQWLEWHQRLQKLNQEAIVEASDLKEEHVKETLVTYGKIPVLVHEVILINVWKHKILPRLLRMDAEPESTFVAYSILYHEAVCIALLELVMFHQGACECLGDSAADLLDYSYDAIAQLMVLEYKEVDTGEKSSDEIKRQKDNLAFDIGIRCLSIVRYIAEHVDRLTLSIADRLLNVHDIPVLLVQILMEKPWLRDGKLYKAGRWISWDGEALGQCEAQVWLALSQIMLNSACMMNYSITDSRRSQLVKLLPLMHPTLLDQLSPLFDLKYWLCKLSMSEQQTAVHKPILLETVLEIKANILAQGQNKWEKIAKSQLPHVFCRDQRELLEIAQSLCEAYNTDLIEKFETKDKSSCATCGKDAIQRCSKCKNVWYCSRSCQVNDWEKHKANCVMSETRC